MQEYDGIFSQQKSRIEFLMKESEKLKSSYSQKLKEIEDYKE